MASRTAGCLVLWLLTGCAAQKEDQLRSPPDYPRSAVESKTPSEGQQPVYQVDAPTGSASTGGKEYLPPYVIKTVFYATDRKPVRSIKSWREERQRRGGSDLEYYGKEWAAELDLGWCNVSIPTRVHEPGDVERPHIFQSESPEKHFVILTLEPKPQEAFFTRLRAQVEKSSQKDAFVFIHGYNVKFADAIMRTAQIAFDVRFEGAPILYSWPSAGALESYPRDGELVASTINHLRTFLEDLIQRASPGKLHLVAHSMGNRALTEVLHHFVQKEGGPFFNEIILAAPDLNRERFLTQIFPGIVGAGKRMTLYASSDDRALITSRRFNEQARAGEGMPHLVVATGLETIDATGIDTDMLGHSYFAQARPVIDDLAAIICRNYEVAKRSLREQNLNGLKYWKIAP